MVAIGERIGDAEHQAQAHRQGARQLIEHLPLERAQGGPQQQVPGRIAPEGQLGGHHQVGAASGRPLAIGQQEGAIAAQVAHERIELAKGEAHQGRGWQRGKTGCCRGIPSGGSICG